MKIITTCTQALGTIKTPEGLRMLYVSDESSHYLGRKVRTWSLEVRKEDGTVEEDGSMSFHGMIWAGPNKVELSLTRKGRMVSSKHHKTVWQGIADAFIAMVLEGQRVGDVVMGECQYLPAAPVEVELPFDALSEDLEEAVTRAQEDEEEQETGRMVIDADFPAYRKKVGEETVNLFNGLIGYDLLTFKGTTSPSDYMVDTDRLYVTIPRFFAGKLHNIATASPSVHSELYRLQGHIWKAANEALEPRSGFIPFYSQNPMNWPCFHELPASLWGIIMRGWLAFLYETKGQGIYDTLEEWMSETVRDRANSHGFADDCLEFEGEDA